MSIKNYFTPKRAREETADDTAEASPTKKMKTASFNVKDILNMDGKALKTIEEYEKKFDEIAAKLLNECVIEVNNKPHRFVEIEFYYTGHNHMDPFSHCDPMQQTCGQWYFHKTGGKYRSGTYKGLDVTFGVENEGFGGILIRGIESLTDGKIIDGPCLSVNHILSLNGTDSIPDFVKGFDFSATNKSKLYIKPTEDLSRREIIKSARVGLAMKKKEESQTLFVMKPYRYVSLPAKIKKGKIHMCLALHIEGKTPQQIQKITGAKIDTINGWIALFNQGTKKKVSDFLGITLENDQICQTIGAWAKEQKLVKAAESGADEDVKEGSDDEEEEEAPKKKAPPKRKAAAKKKKVESDDDDDDEGNDAADGDD